MAYVDIQNGDDSDGILLKLNKGLALADKSVTSVDTMQELCDLPTDLGMYLNATTSGFHSADGGGGGHFHWDASRSKTEHNGGTVVDPLKGNQLGGSWPGTWFTPNASGSGCWVLSSGDGDLNILGFGAKPVVDSTLAIQRALDVAGVQGRAVRGVGEFYCGPIAIPENVTLVSSEESVDAAIRKILWFRPVSGSTGDAFFTLARGSALIGIGLVGQGASGIQNACVLDDSRGVVSKCMMQSFPASAILALGGQCIIRDNFAYNCLLERSFSEQRGVLEIHGADYWVINGEYSASVSIEDAISSADLYCAAVYVPGTNGFFSNVVGEISDVGFVITGAHNRFTACRADLNYGHGFVVTSSGSFNGCAAMTNSAHASGEFDGFHVLSTAGTNVFNGCSSVSVSGSVIGSKSNFTHRYNFYDGINSDVNKSRYNNCYADTRATLGQYYSVAFAGASISLPSGPAKTRVVVDGTPDIGGYRNWKLNASVATDITGFSNGVAGGEITIQPTNANITFKHGSPLKLPGSADISASASTIYVFRLENGVWYLL